MNGPSTSFTKKRNGWTLAKMAASMDNLSKAWEAQKALPRCGAQRRSAEGTCQNLALDNGRCRLHGGRTPKGKDWHKVQLTNPGRSAVKLAKKEREIARRRARQAARVAAMSDEERTRYHAWHQARAAGPATQREARRKSLEIAQTLAALRDTPRGETHLDELARVERLLAQQEARAAELREAADHGDGEGDIFG